MIKSRIKVLIARVITANWFGRLVRLIFRDRINFSGVPVASCSAWVSPKVSAQLFWGIYESAERRFVQSSIDASLPVVELGSSIGGVSSHIARKLMPGQRLVCVEANPHLLPLLKKNLKINAGHLEVGVMHAAISTQPGTISFAVSESSLSSQIGSRDDIKEMITAPSRTLSDVISEQGLEAQSFQLVMDIEGAEAGIVLEDSDALKGCCRIVPELHDTVHQGNAFKVDQLVEAIVGLGFRVCERYGAVVVFDRKEAAL